MANNNMYAILYARAIEYFTNHYVLILWTQTCIFVVVVFFVFVVVAVGLFPFSFGSHRLGADYLNTNNKSKQILLKKKQTVWPHRWQWRKRLLCERDGMVWMAHKWRVTGNKSDAYFRGEFPFSSWHSTEEYENSKHRMREKGGCLCECVHKWISEQVIRAMLARLQCVCIKHLKRFHISWLMSMVCDIHSWNMHSVLARWKVSFVFFLLIFIPLSLHKHIHIFASVWIVPLQIVSIYWMTENQTEKMYSWHTALKPSSFILHRWWHTGRWWQRRTLKCGK